MQEGGIRTPSLQPTGTHFGHAQKNDESLAKDHAQAGFVERGGCHAENQEEEVAVFGVHRECTWPACSPDPMAEAMHS